MNNQPKIKRAEAIDAMQPVFNTWVDAVDDIPPNKAREVSEKLLKKAPDRIRDESAAIGTAVHDIVERLANGEVFDVDPMYAGHVASWRQFMSDWQVEVFAVYELVENADR